MGLVITALVVLYVYLRKTKGHQEANLPAVSEDVNLPAVREQAEPITNDLDNKESQPQ
jgi:hypothetical protein